MANKNVDWNAGYQQWKFDQKYGEAINGPQESDTQDNTINWDDNYNNWKQAKATQQSQPKPLSTFDKFNSFLESKLPSYKTFEQNNPNTKGAFKLLGYTLETPYRLPFVANLLGSAAETVGGKNAIAEDAPINQYSRTTGNKVADTVSGFAGNALGLALTPSTGIGTNPGSNMLNATDNLSNQLALKATSKLANKAPNWITPIAKNAVKGTVEGSIGNALNSARLNDSTSNIAKSGLEGALGGALLGGGISALGQAGSRLAPKLDDLITTSRNTTTSNIDNINNPTGLLKPTLTTKGINTSNKLDLLQNPLKRDLTPNMNKTLNATVEKPNLNTKLELPGEFKPTGVPGTDQNGVLRSSQKIVPSGKDKLSFKDNLSNLYTRAVDINNPLKKVDDKTYTLATNSKNVGGTVDYILKDGLADMNGKTIGPSLKSLVNIPKNQEKDFWEYALQRHNVARTEQGKPIFTDFTPEQSKLAINQFEELHPDWKKKADDITNWIDTFMKEWGVKSGITDEGLYSVLREQYPNYIPTQRDFSELEQGTLKGANGRGFIDQRTPIKKAQGSSRDIVNPVENIMNLVNRTVRTARYNEVGQNLLKTIENDPVKASQFAEVIPEGTPINPNVNNVVTVLRGGKPVNIQVNNKQLLDSLNGLYKTQDLNVLETGVKSFNNLFKTLITQKNPVFAIRNIARDIPTAYVYGNEANPIKFGADLLKASKDLATNSDIAQQYKALGGGGSNFFNSQNPAKSATELLGRQNILKKGLNKVGNTIEAFNNLTESAPRLAEFKRELQKTGDTQKALFAANDVTTNFSRGGDVIKKWDNRVPYLNASFQGLDKLYRQFRDRPISTILKGATAITAPTLVLDYINKDNPNYQQLDNRTKDNYYVFPQKDGTFIKIPKSRELGVLFSSLTERILRQQAGDENAFKGFGSTVATNFAPNNPLNSNLQAPLAINLPMNKDFAGRTIVPENMKDRSKALQYDETTSELAKLIGAKTNFSPKQIDYLIRSYTGVVGQLVLPAATKTNWDTGTPLKKTLMPITSQFTADALKNNQNITDFYDNKDVLTRNQKDFEFQKVPEKPSNLSDYAWNKIKPKSDSNDLYKVYNSTATAISSIKQEINDINNNSPVNDETKRKIQELQKVINDLAKQANDIYNNPKNASGIRELDSKTKKLTKEYK